MAEFRSGAVVVGVDPARPSRSAVVWAAEQARVRRTRLLLVAVRTPTGTPVGTGGTRTTTTTPTATAARALGWAVVTARAVGDPGQDVDVRLVDADDPATVLLRFAEECQDPPGSQNAGDQRSLLVLGRPAARVHATAPRTGDQPGATGRAVLQASDRPVLLVADEPSTDLRSTRRGTLLGHDGSPGAWAAAQEAAAEAHRCREPLVLVRSYRTVLHQDGPSEPLTAPVRWELSSREARWHRQDVDAVAARIRRDHPGLDVRCRTAQSSAAFTALAAFAPGMRLVVLGRNGFWAAPGTLGRDLVAVLRWSSAPVLVVPATQPAGGTAGSPQISWWNTPG